MDIIRQDRLIEFAQKHPNTRSPLNRWHRLMQDGDFRSLEELRSIFPHADRVGNLKVFNIAGNSTRIITYIFYAEQRVYIRDVLTHTEYDKGKWRE